MCAVLVLRLLQDALHNLIREAIQGGLGCQGCSDTNNVDADSLAPESGIVVSAGGEHYDGLAA